MLVLSRKPGEKVVIGRDIIVTLIESKGGRVRIGISAPDNVPIFRGELQERMDAPLDSDYGSEAGLARKSIGLFESI